MIRHQRDERGAVAVMAAILSVALLGVAAFAVDFGQVYAKRSSLQSAADQAVLAAAAELDGTNTCTAKAINAATSYLQKNWIDSGQDPIDVNLSDASVSNGRLVCAGWKAQLTAPTATVNYGIAKALNSGNSSVEVPAYAEAMVKSPKAAVMPSFAVSGCDFGNQTLLDPPSGPSAPYVPTLPHPTPTNSIELLQGYDSNNLPKGLNPGAITLNQATSLTIYSKNNDMKDVNRVSFSVDGNTTPEVIVTPAPANVGNSDLFLPSIPPAVSSVEKVWWIRVSKDGGATWSVVDQALPLRVGNPVLECAGVSNSGNFGTIDLPHLNPAASAEKAIEYNIATQVDYGLSTLGGGAYCSPGSGGAIAPTADGTNCVKAKTGFAGNPATNGLITGVDASTPGRLVKSTTSGCAPNKSSNTFQTPNIKGSKYNINDDTLSCFFLSTSTTVATVSSPSYPATSPPLISKKIFESPRFFWVPVFGVQPDNGNSNNYAIKDFRPAFITGELPSSTHTSKVMDPGTDNGMVFTSSGIQSLKVVFFNANTLPKSSVNGQTMNYIGIGTKVMVLTD